MCGKQFVAEIRGKMLDTFKSSIRLVVNSLN